jgi:tetratricopeptide (TPR) repeat protein
LRPLIGLFAALAGLCALAGLPSAATTSECFSEDNERRILGCSALIERSDLSGEDRAIAYSMRALAYSLKGLYDLALPDYDAAIRLSPDFAVALNNRAWALYKSGRATQGLGDVERSLSLSPGSPHALDTRAHIRQAMGEPAAALADYERAMHFGGERMIKLYQCGLQAQGLYGGDIDGLYSSVLRRALEACVGNPGCDPLPADEECRRVTS